MMRLGLVLVLVVFFVGLSQEKPRKKDHDTEARTQNMVFVLSNKLVNSTLPSNNKLGDSTVTSNNKLVCRNLFILI